ncbi:MAG: hypothetical protein K0S45_2243 [Nitrospira sp.]|nr:hypothetical protein [Nitrospira sp.]
MAGKPIHLLSFVPGKDQQSSANPFAPSPLRATISKVFVKLEDLTERFEDWCQYGSSQEQAIEPLGRRLSKWLEAPVARHAEDSCGEQTGLVPARQREGSVGEVIFRIRDRAGYVQRALMAQARELKEWVIQHTQSTQAELDQLREQVSAQQDQVEELTEQLQDLRALVTSQQQVLMYMGKDMDQPSRLDLSLVPPRSLPFRDQNSARARRDAASETSKAPYLNA